MKTIVRSLIGIALCAVLLPSGKLPIDGATTARVVMAKAAEGRA